MPKIRILWFCIFYNSEIQSLLPLWKNISELASWIPNSLRGFEDRQDIEMHVIAPHHYLKRITYFQLRNINYYFIPIGIPVFHKTWPRCFQYDVLTNFHSFRNQAQKLVKKIDPDLINLIGAENCIYSTAILDFKEQYPILITIQGFISQMKASIKLTTMEKKRIEIEELILKSFKYFGGEQDSSNYISIYNQNHIFYKLYFPVNEELALNTIEISEEIDCIYFGGLTKNKGAEDFIKVISEVKRKKPDVKACVVGGGNVKPLLSMAKKLKCFENIKFTGFIETQKELFERVKTAKVFLAPPYFERLSSTIREAMFLKVPIVAYSTGGIPYINEFDEIIYLVRTGDYKGMARRAIVLLENETLRKNVAEKAYQYALKEFTLSVNVERLVSAYKIIIDNKNDKECN